jgi:hypothetical protein
MIGAGKGLFKAIGAERLTCPKRPTPQEADMTTDQMRRLGEDSMGAALSSFSAWTNNVQAIAAEMADYSKKSFEGASAALEKLAGAKSLEKAAEVQAEYLRSAHEDFVARASKLGELYVALAREAYKPFESAFAKASTTR